MNIMSYMSLLQPQTSSRTIRDFLSRCNRTNRNKANVYDLSSQSCCLRTI